MPLPPSKSKSNTSIGGDSQPSEWSRPTTERLMDPQPVPEAMDSERLMEPQPVPEAMDSERLMEPQPVPDAMASETAAEGLTEEALEPPQHGVSHYSHNSVTDALKMEPTVSDEEGVPFWTGLYTGHDFSIWTLLPPSTWLPAYVRTVFGRHSEEDLTQAGGLPFSLKGDAIAGLTVGFMLVPQSLAFALLAGLPVQIGLYSSFLPLVAYAAFGTIRQVQPGPTALMSLLTGQALDSMGLDDDADRIKGAALMALCVGAISIVLGAVRFGFIVDFMSHCVMAAFCSAAGVTIASSQLKHLFGIEMGRKEYWWQTVSYLVSHLNETDGPTFAIGGTLLFLLLFLKHWKSAGSKDKRSAHKLWRWFPKDKESLPFRIVKIIADMSSLLSVIVGWLWGWVYRQCDVQVKFVGEVEGGGFKFILPEFSDNLKIDLMLTSAAIMAIVGYLETIAVGGKFAAQARYAFDANQELLALGLSNAASGLMSGYPGTGSFSRTAVNAMFGATSLVACAISSVLVFLSVYLLLPVIAWLPLASLAPIIIQGAIGVISIHDFVVGWKASKKEFLVMIATFGVSLGLNVKYGLLVGFVLSILKTMHELANPNLAVCGRLADNSFRDIRNFPKAELLPNAVVVRMDARLSFANSRKMKEFCVRAADVWESQGDRFDRIRFIIVDCKSINHVDVTGCETLERLAESFEKRGQSLVLANLKGPAAKCITLAGTPKVIRKHGGHLCLDMDQALAIATGADKEGQQSRHCLSMLVQRIETANQVVKSAGKHHFFDACVTPQTLVKRGDDPVKQEGDLEVAQSRIESSSPKAGIVIL